MVYNNIVLGYDTLKLDELDERQKIVAELINNKVHLGESLYFSHNKDYSIIVDIIKGSVIRFNNDKYSFSAKYRKLSAINLKDGSKYCIFDNGNLMLDGIDYSDKYIALSNKKYDGVRFGSTYSLCIKVHIIVAAMHWNYSVLDALGYFRTKEVHHKEPWSKSRNNSITNLSLIDKVTHNNIHKPKIIIEL